MSLSRTAISLPDEVMKTGKRAAKRCRRSLSSYIATLIERDANLGVEFDGLGLAASKARPARKRKT